MSDDRPLPPNWESRFDPSTKRWFFVDHVNKKTSWDDPRPRYYSMRQRRGSSSTEKCVPAPQSPTLDTSYASLSSDYGKVTPSSPHANESDSRDEEFMEYLQALRAAYPDYKERQLAKLMEKWLGDSPGLKKFLATHFKRKPSDASDTTSKRGSVASAQKDNSFKRNDSPHSISGYEELSDNKRVSCTSPLIRSVLHASAIQKSATNQSSHLSQKGPNHSNITKHDSLSSTENAIHESTDLQAEPQQSNHQTSKTKNAVSGTVESTEKDVTTDKQVVPQEASSMNRISVTSREVSHVQRCIPRGSDPQLRITRLIPNGPNRQLACGPDPTLRCGPNPALLGRHSRSEVAVPYSLFCTDIT